MTDLRTRVTATVHEIIRHQLDAAPEAILESASLIDDLGADSLAVVEMVLALEEQFGIGIPDEEAENIRTVGDVVTYIEGRLGAQASAAE